jgi:hypothetical protein
MPFKFNLRHYRMELLPHVVGLCGLNQVDP